MEDYQSSDEDYQYSDQGSLKDCACEEEPNFAATANGPTIKAVKSFTYEEEAVISLVTAQALAAGITILWLCLSQYHPLPHGLFTFSLKGKWLLDVILGCLTFPLIPQFKRFNQNLIRLPLPRPSRRNRFVSSREKWLHVIKVSILAPLLEEIIFRGILIALPARFIPVWCAILVSSIFFAIAHDSQKMLPIGFLGMVMGATFSRSWNLFPSILLHSLYNICVYLELFP